MIDYTANKAILLMNLGSPDSTSVKDVKHYLTEFLLDKRVIDKGSSLYRNLLVRGIIVPFRAPKSAHAYKRIWTDEGSPLIVISKKLQESVQKQTSLPVSLAMRYGNPSVKDSFDELSIKMPNLKEVIVVPLYPHYAMSSYETAIVHTQDVYTKNNYSFSLKVLPPFYNNQDYINAMCTSIKPYIANDFDYLLFSFHGIPERHLTLSDPTHQHCLKDKSCCQTPHQSHSTCYRHQCIESMHLIAAQLGINNDKYGYSFQSRLGKEPWLKPYTDETLKELPSKGYKNILVVCPAFVSDCLETLEEIEIEGLEIFKNAGGTNFEMIPCLNTHPQWVSTIVKWVNEL